MPGKHVFRGHPISPDFPGPGLYYIDDAGFWHPVAGTPVAGDTVVYQGDGTFAFSSGSEFSGFPEPLTNGDPDNPEIVFDGEGDVIMVWVDG